MSRKYNFLKMSFAVTPFVLAVALSMVAPVKADSVRPLDTIKNDGEHITHYLNGINGSGRIEFTTASDYIEGNSYSFTRTYKLADPGSVFTSFVWNPAQITMNLQHFINNGGLSFPAADVSDTYTGTIGWTGAFSISDLEDFVKTYTYGVEGVDYTPDEISEGHYNNVVSQSVSAPFTDFPSFELDADDLRGTGSITIGFSLSDIFFNTSFDTSPAGLAPGWEGTIDGSFLVGWAANPEAPPTTPEPASLLIFGAGMAGAGFVAYRKRRGKLTK